MGENRNRHRRKSRRAHERRYVFLQIVCEVDESVRDCDRSLLRRNSVIVQSKLDSCRRPSICDLFSESIARMNKIVRFHRIFRSVTQPKRVVSHVVFQLTFPRFRLLFDRGFFDDWHEIFFHRRFKRACGGFNPIKRLGNVLATNSASPTLVFKRKSVRYVEELEWLI